MQPTAHSRFGASSAYRWMACPGSVRLSEGAERIETEYAFEGTMLHEIAATILEAWRRGDSLDEDAVAAQARLNREQRDVVATYTRAVRDEEHLLSLSGDEPQVLIEQRFSLPGLHPEFFGTGDATIYTRSALRIFDLKCGRGVAVETDKGGTLNSQLGYYALGALEKIGWNVSLNGIIPPRGMENMTDIEIVVVQPRLGGVKRRKVAITELLDLAEDLVFAAKLADEPNAPLKAGDWCRFCPARAACPALRSRVLDEARMDFATGDIVSPDQLEGAELARALKNADLMEMWVRAIREHARHQLSTGRAVPGFKLVERRGNRRWKDEGAVFQELQRSGLRSVEYAETSLKSPAQVERALKSAGIDGAWMDELIERGSAGSALVPDSDTRPEVRVGAAADFTAQPV